MPDAPNRFAIAGLYSDANWATKTFIRLRWTLTPYLDIASRLPSRGRMLDLGCGHGLFALALQLTSDDREILGVDHDPDRIRLAAAAASMTSGAKSTRFEVGDFEIAASVHSPGAFAGVAMIDVLHYLDADAQRTLIQQSFRLLEPGGVLVVREVDPDSGPVAHWNRIYEKIATRMGFTHSRGKILHFRGVDEWRELLERTGFVVTSERCGSRLFSDRLYVATRPPKTSPQTKGF